MNLLHETILITVSLHADGISHETLTLLTKHHGFDEVEILDAIELLIKRRRLGVNKELKLTCLEQVPEEIPAGYLAAAEKYKESKKATLWDWFCGIFDRIKFALALFIITTFFAIGLAAQDWTYVELTAYCPCSICCGDYADGKTANMTDVRRVPYNFAADRSLPIGTRIYLPKGLGLLDNVRASDRWFKVDDRGGALDTEARRYGIIRLDLRVKDHWQAVKYGRRVIPVIIERAN